MKPVSHIWGLMVVISAYFEAIASSHDGCAEDVMSASSACLPGHLYNGLISNMTAVAHDCRWGTFERSVTCLSRVVSGCRGDSERLHLLNSYTDIGRVQETWTDMCDNVHELKEHHTCWSETSTLSASCIKDKLEELKQRLMLAISSRAKSDDSTVTTTADALSNLRLYCKTSRDILQCFQPILQQKCPRHITGLLTNLYMAFQPPICQDDSRENTCNRNTESGSSPLLSIRNSGFLLQLIVMTLACVI